MIKRIDLFLCMDWAQPLRIVATAAATQTLSAPNAPLSAVLVATSPLISHSVVVLVGVMSLVHKQLIRSFLIAFPASRGPGYVKQYLSHAKIRIRLLA